MADQYLSIDIRIEYANFKLQVDTQIPLTGITAIFGHSGSGKSSLLRAIAGLENSMRGSVKYHQQIWQDQSRKLATHKRPIGFVFQDSSLLNHLNVYQNLRFGWQRTEDPVSEIEFSEICQLLAIEPLFQQAPDDLSGGERQRVAIAQALVTKPKILLMDEPLASLDLKRKKEILSYLEKLPEKFNVPILYVSHSADEVARLANQVILLENGGIHSQGDIRSILSQGLLQHTIAEEPFSIMFGRVTQACNNFGLTEVQVANEIFKMPAQDVRDGQSIRLHIDAKDISLSLLEPQQTSILNVFKTRVVKINDTSDKAQMLVQLMIGDYELSAKISRYSCEQLSLAAGTALFAQIKAVSVVQ